MTTLVSSQSQLTDAVARERISRRRPLKRTIKHMRQNCPVFAIERGYLAAVREEDYAAAASFRDQGAGLVGWWCGRGETEDEPGGQYGVMMQITPARPVRGRGATERARPRVDAGTREVARARSIELAKEGPFNNGRFGNKQPRGRRRRPRGRWCLRVVAGEGFETGDGHVGAAVRVDHFGAALDGDDAFASEGEGIKNDDAGTRSRDERSSASGKGFATALGGFPRGPIGAHRTACVERPIPRCVPSRTPNAFAGWRVSNGAVRVSRGETSADAAVSGSNPNPENPFPFDVDGVSMEELLSSSARRFMAEFKNTPGFAEDEKQKRGSRRSTPRPRARRMTRRRRKPRGSPRGSPRRLRKATPTCSRRSGGEARAPPTQGAARAARPRILFREVSSVINETDGDAGVVDLDDLEAFDDDDDAFDLEKALSDDDDDDDDDGFVVDLGAAAAALLDGGDAKNRPRAGRAAAGDGGGHPRAIEARGMGRCGFRRRRRRRGG